MSMLETGAAGEASFIVQQSDTAAALAISPEDAFPPVFASARMIALMELAAARAMKPMLQAGELSVGVTMDVSHTAATAVGSRVSAVATYLRNEGKIFVFKVKAFDEAGPVGSGKHSRAIVDVERLMTGAARRMRG